MGEQIFCPYCNTVVNPPSKPRAGQAVTCPRCEESFRLLGTSTGPVGESPMTVLQGDNSTGPLPPPGTMAGTTSNRQVAVMVMAGMVLVALVGLTFALMSRKERRSHDAGLQGRSWKRLRQEDIQAIPVRKQAPLDLDALRYLPADTNLLAGAHLGELIQGGGMKTLKMEIPGLDGGRSPLDQTLERMTGLRTTDMDHVVLGARLDQNGLSRPLVVIRMRQAYNGDEVRSHLKASKAPGVRNRPVYEIPQGLVSFPDDRTLVFGLLAVPPSAMPTAQRPSGQGLPPEITDALRQHVAVGSPLWAVGDSREWTTILVLLRGFIPLDEQGQKMLAGVRTPVVWLEMADQPTTRAVIRCVNAAVAEELKKYLLDRFHKRESLKVERHEDMISVQYRRAVQ